MRSHQHPAAGKPNPANSTIPSNRDVALHGAGDGLSQDGAS